jgi:hypothetical protein
MKSRKGRREEGRILTKEMNKVIISYGLTESSPTIPPLMTVLSIHVEAHNRSTPMTGAVSSPRMKYDLFSAKGTAGVRSALVVSLVSVVGVAVVDLSSIATVGATPDLIAGFGLPFRLKSREMKYGRGIRRGKITRASIV